MKNRKTLTLIAILLVCTLLFALASCKAKEDKNIWDNATYKEDTTLGEGATTFTLKVKALEKTVTFTISTDKKTLADALLELSLIEGEEGDYGLFMVKMPKFIQRY